MLVITRKEGSSFTIGTDIKITVMSVRGTLTKLHIKQSNRIEAIVLKDMECFYISSDINLHIIKRRGKLAKIGIEAPKEILIERDNCIKGQRL